jgi:hypothetical protein
VLSSWLARFTRALAAGLVAFAAVAAPAAAQTTASVSTVATQSILAVGETTTVYVRVADVTNLYGVDVGLSFDATALEVVDADSETAGTQIQQWPDLPTQERSKAWTLAHSADNGSGTVSLISTLVNPQLPVSGTASLLAMTVRALKAGVTTIAITQCELSTPDGEPIAHTTAAGALTITGTLAGYRFALPATPVVAGTAFALTIEAVDSSANLVASYAGAAALSASAGLQAPTAALTFAAGRWQGMAVLTAAGTGRTLTANTGGVASTSAGITVLPAAAASVALAAQPAGVDVGGSTVLTAIVVDAYGNLVADGTAVTFTCTSGTFLAGGSSAVVTTSNGLAVTTFTGTAEGTATVSATTGAASDSADVAVSAPAPGFQRVMLPLVKMG